MQSARSCWVSVNKWNNLDLIKNQHANLYINIYVFKHNIYSYMNMFIIIYILMHFKLECLMKYIVHVVLKLLHSDSTCKNAGLNLTRYTELW